MFFGGKKKEMLGWNTLFPPKDSLPIFWTVRMGESHSNKAAFS